MAAGRLMRGFVTVGGWTLGSRLLGFVRDIAIAAAMGAGPMAEAFFIAFSLPNMFRRFFAEGAFNTAFVPLFSKRVQDDEETGGESARIFARDAFTGLALILIVLTVLAQVFMPFLVLAMASGFAGDARFDLAVSYGRIAFPYILFISLGALLSGVLNAVGRFSAAAAAPLLLNVIFLAAIGVAGLAGFEVGRTLSWAVPVAGVAQFALVWVAAARAGFRLVPRRPRMTPELKRLAIIAGPAALTQGVTQVNLLVGRQVSSFFDGAIAWLSYADRLYQLPLGVVGIAIGVVLLPDLSRRLRAGDADGGRWSFSRAGEMALALTVPAAVALVVVPLPMITVLFERGEFTADDSARTALAVAVYGLGLPAFVLQKVLLPAYFARENTRTPFNFALVAMVVNAGLAIGLAQVVGYIAAAFGTTIAGWVMTILLWRGTSRMGEATRFDDRFRARLWRIVAASLVMGAVLWGLWVVAGPLFAIGATKLAALAGLILAGMATYALAGQAFGAFRIAEFREAFRR